MGPKISPRAAVFIFSAVFLGSEAAAQTGGDAFPSAATKSRNAPSVVSIDVLRHPITPKVSKRLRNAIEKMHAGDHEAAIELLRKTLAKFPDSAAYVDNLLGVEYVKTDRYREAVEVLEQAAALLPRDAMTHYNLGLALVCDGDYERARREVQRALELDPKNTRMQARLDALAEHAEGVASVKTAASLAH